MHEVSVKARRLSSREIAALERAFHDPPARHTQLVLALQAADDIARRNGRFGELLASRGLAARSLYEAAFGTSTDAELWYGEATDSAFDGALAAVGCAVAAVTLGDLLAPEMRDLLLAPWAEVVPPG